MAKTVFILRRSPGALLVNFDRIFEISGSHSYYLRDLTIDTDKYVGVHKLDCINFFI